MFGCELSALCARENTNVPLFLVKFIEHIEKNGLDVVGIYRLSGNAASVTKLRYLVEQGKLHVVHWITCRNGLTLYQLHLRFKKPCMYMYIKVVCHYAICS